MKGFDNIQNKRILKYCICTCDILFDGLSYYVINLLTCSLDPTSFSSGLFLFSFLFCKKEGKVTTKKGYTEDHGLSVEDHGLSSWDLPR